LRNGARRAPAVDRRRVPPSSFQGGLRATIAPGVTACFFSLCPARRLCARRESSRGWSIRNTLECPVWNRFQRPECGISLGVGMLPGGQTASGRRAVGGDDPGTMDP
jgi:hypothetical protein